MRSVMTTIGWVLVASLLFSGCKKEEQTEKVEADAGTEAGADLAQLDPELAQAMAQASAKAPAGNAPSDSGPPPNGIFPPGRADKEASSGTPGKIVVGGEGSDPKISLLPAQLAPGSKRTGAVQIHVQQGQQGGLPIEFALTLEAQKPKDNEAPISSVKMTAKVTGATIAVAGAGKELEGIVAKTKGARIDYFVSADGVGSGYKVEAPKGAPADLAIWLETLRDTLALVTLPVPQKPVGVGAYWMVTTREGVLGLDLVSYRMFKVEAIKDGVATLSVNAKRYAASATLDLAGMPPGMPKEMSEFQSVSEGRLELKAGGGFPLGGEANSALAIGIGPPPGPKQRGQQQALMIQSRAMLQFAN